MTTSEMIFALCDPIGVSGAEQNAVEAAKKMLDGCGECSLTPLGSLLCRVKSAPAGRPHLMLTAHIDSVGMIVSYIDDKGFLRVGNCGGIDRSMLLAAHVAVHTKQGDLFGVICTVPPHLGQDESRVPKMDEICVDVGMSAEKARERIMLGDRVTICAESGSLMGSRISSKTIDDRGGCVSVILAAQKLAAEKLDCSLTVALTAMEEVGGQGARTAANLIDPTHAIAVDVSFGHTPDLPRYKCGELDKGPMIGVAPVLDNGMFEGLKNTALQKEIPYQVEVMGGNTGTDADGIAMSRGGVRCALVSIPLRYMHTPIEVISTADVEAVAELITAYVVDEFGGGR